MRFRISRTHLSLIVYALVLICGAAACFRKPIFEDQFDLLPYMGVVELIRTSDPQLLHQRVYAEARASIPADDYANLVANPNGYRQDMAANHLHFAELLPFYSIRPLFIETVSLLHFGPLHLAKVRAMTLISTLSYAAMGIVLFLWLFRHLEAAYAALFSSLMMLSAPIMKVGRTPTPDALSCASVLLALYLGIEKRWTFGCILLLLVSVFTRTDNVILVAAIVFYFVFVCDKSRRIRIDYGAVLLALATGSLIIINRFSGNYGWSTLFYNSFVKGILNPGEAVVHVSARQYIAQLATGHFSKTSSMIWFAAIGAMAVLALSKRLTPDKTLRDIAVILLATSATRYVLFPTFWDRHYAAFYLYWSVAMLVGLASAMGIESRTGGVRTV